MKPQDPQAERITFGVELETTLPATAGLVVGAYHIGTPVRVGADVRTSLPLNAPTFSGNHWKAERDGSIRIKPGRVACEFVSPILKGGAGVEHLLQFLDWANAIGANVNASCGCHITVGVESIIGSNDPQAMSEFARKLAHIARWHAMSLYGQTGMDVLDRLHGRWVFFDRDFTELYGDWREWQGMRASNLYFLPVLSDSPSRSPQPFLKFSDTCGIPDTRNHRK